MHNLKTDLNDSVLKYNANMGDKIIQSQIFYDSQLEEIFEPEGRLIVYLSVFGLFGIITAILYLFFF